MRKEYLTAVEMGIFDSKDRIFKEQKRLKILEAYKSGIEIEFKEYDSEVWEVCDFPPVLPYLEYRIRSKNTYRPYLNVEEIPIEKRIIMSKKCRIKYKIGIYVESPMFGGKIITFVLRDIKFVLRDIKTDDYMTIAPEVLLKNFEHEDGTPCGVLE